jgi:hypothetical protein
MVTAWQLYSSRELSAQIEYWEKTKSENRRPWPRSSNRHHAQHKSEPIKFAYELMEMLIRFRFHPQSRRSHPANIRIDGISSNEAGVVAGGSAILGGGELHDEGYVEEPDAIPRSVRSSSRPSRSPR